MPQPGFIDHIGIGVPDLAAAKRYYDGLMQVIGLKEWFKTGTDGRFNYGPDGAQGSQLFFDASRANDKYSRLGYPGLQHLAFVVESRAIVREAHAWALANNSEVLRDSPRPFAKYGEHCYATYWIDPHGFMLEAVCHTPEES